MQPHDTIQLPLFVLERVCTDCGETKPLECFAKGNGAYGRRAYCKPCHTKRQQDYRKRNAQIERPIPTEKTCPSCKRTLPGDAFNIARGEKSGRQRYCQECQRPQLLASYYKNRQAWLDYRHRYYRKNWTRSRTLAKRWRKNNRIKDREYFYRWYGRKKGTQVGKVDFEAILERDNRTCYLCGLPIGDDLHFDHVIPLSRGGAHTMENIRATHAHCNMSKSAKTPDEYLHGIG